MRDLSLPLVFVGASLAVGCVTPRPKGAEGATTHYEVRTDDPDPELTRQVSRTAEQVHAALARDFGAEVAGGLPLIIYRQRQNFDRELAPSLKDRGFVGQFGEGYVLVYWPDEVSGKETLAHELVHRFNASLAPDLPYWLDEGLAKALAPRRAHGDWLSALADMSDDELRDRIRSLESLPAGEDYALRCLVAAGVARFALDSEEIRTVRELRGYRADAARFLRWLRGTRVAHPDRFPPVLGEAGPG
jgi:hypothetical protein